jgi:hypothetical protein
MSDFAAACAWGRGGTKPGEDEGEAFAGGKGKPEDEDPAPVLRVIRVHGAVESLI